MLKRVFFLATLSLMLAGALGGQAQAKRVLDEKLDLKTLTTLATNGQLIYFEQHGGNITDRLVVTLINAPLDKVWSVITDFSNYNKFIPTMLPPKVTKKSDKEYNVDFVLDISIYGPIKTTQKYSTAYELSKPYLYMYEVGKPKVTKDKANYWKLVPVAGGKKTLVFYLDKAPDLKSLGTLVYNIASTKPELALALQVSPVSIVVQQLKEYVERKKK